MNVQTPAIGIEGGYSGNTTSDHRPVSARFDLSLIAPPTSTTDGPDLIQAVNNRNSDIQPFGLRVMQGGAQTAPFVFNFKQVCTGSARTATSENPGELDVTVLGNPTPGETVEVIANNTAGEAVVFRVSNAQGQAVSQTAVFSAGGGSAHS